MVRPAENNVRFQKRRANNLLITHSRLFVLHCRTINNRFLPDGRCGRKAGKNPPQPPMEQRGMGGARTRLPVRGQPPMRSSIFFLKCRSGGQRRQAGRAGGSHRRNERRVAQCVSTSSVTSPRTFAPNSFHHAPVTGHTIVVATIGRGKLHHRLVLRLYTATTLFRDIFLCSL